mmetsp:Transcript_16970/g.43330  ORF Transcript_16970/g.43330 Transcript_16970/m.43330 type:complete len:188 (+) Transcript_16970:82-645(+)
MAKKAVSAYWLWLGENRADIVKEHGLAGKKGSEVSKKAGELWKAIDPATKKKYDDLAAKDKARYEEEVKTLGKRERQPRKDKEGRAGKRAKKDKEAPKRPMSAYFLWTQENREAVMTKYKIEKAGPEFTRKAAEEWKTVSDAVRKEYDEKAAKLKEQYQKDLAAYQAQKAEAGGDEDEEEEDEADDV